MHSNPFFEIHSDQLSNKSCAELIQSYSRYKYGESEMVKYYARLISDKIKKEVSLANTCIVAPPYSTLLSSTVPLTRLIALELNIPLAELRSLKGGDRNKVYASLKTETERKTSKNNDEVILYEPEKYKNMRAVLFDDLENTGATFSLMEERMQYYAIPIAGSYSLIKLNTDDPSYEEWINTYLLNYDQNKLIEILNAPNTIINRHTLKSILLSSNETRSTIMSRLSNEALDKFNKAKDVYFATTLA